MLKSRTLLPCVVAAILVSGSALAGTGEKSHSSVVGEQGRRPDSKTKRFPAGSEKTTLAGRSRHQAAFIKLGGRLTRRLVPTLIVGAVLVKIAFGIPTYKEQPTTVYYPFSEPGIHTSRTTPAFPLAITSPERLQIP